MASEDKATEGQIKRLYAVLHSVGLDPTQWKKDQNIASYAKLTRAQCSAFIDEVEALEAEQKDKLHAERREVEQGTRQRQEFGDRAEAEAQRIREEQGRTAPAPKPAMPTVDELISKYLEIIVKTTVAVGLEERITDREKGYAVNAIYHSVKDALENGKGGNHEEQA